jgi:hypothetical protein
VPTGEPISPSPNLTSARPGPPDVLDPLRARADSGGRFEGRRNWWIVGAWVFGLLILFTFFVRIAMSIPVNSDGANNALQAWDMLHGNFLLHNWVIGDATYYTFDLPVIAIAEAFLGMNTVALHVALAMIFLVVVVLALAIARIDSRGAATAIRYGVVIAVMTAGLADGSFVFLLKPDHAGTSAFLLACFLLIDRAPSRWFTPPVLFVILCAGQIGDGLVLYVAAPAIALVAFYRWVDSGGRRSFDLVIAAAAVLSVPAALLVRAMMIRLGGYAMVAPDTAPAPIAVLGRHLELTAQNIGALFGVMSHPWSPLGVVAAPFGALCLLAAAFGFGKAVWNWPKASWAEQLLCVAVVANVVAYAFYRLPSTGNTYEIAAVVPCGAILAARAVPSAVSGAWRARVAILAAASAALLPLTATAGRPVQTQPTTVRLVDWLDAHGLRYGLAGYWNASVLTFVSGDKVQVRAVQPWHGKLAVLEWETDNAWYIASEHDATFVIAGRGRASATNMDRQEFERYLGKPAVIYRMYTWYILVYHRNLLRSVIFGPNGLYSRR